jgi:hypothetical protein
MENLNIVRPTDKHADLKHRIRQYYIRCAEHVIHLAPTEQLRDAIAALKSYDDDPTLENRTKLKAFLRDFTRKKPVIHYDAPTQIYLGLKHVLWLALHCPTSCMSASTQSFTEAVYCAAKPAARGQDASQQAEYERQHKLWEELFPAEVKS